jgi:DsbE subfamily thiol:disulfide oxidoreductase
MGLFSKDQSKSKSFDTLNNGKIFSDFELPSVGSDKIFSPRIFTGKVVMVNVFASWCEPCAAEHPTLMKLAKKVNIYGVAWKDKPDAVFRYLQERGNPFQQVGNDENGKATIPMFLTGVPETFLLNKKGQIILHYKAALDDEVVNKLIIPLIDKLNNENVQISSPTVR